MTQPADPHEPSRPPWGGEDGHLRSDYRARLAELDRELVSAGRATARLLEPVGDLTADLDEAVLEHAMALLADVRERSVAIEEAAFTLTALESPVGRDLREVVGVIRAVYDVARTARLGLHVLEHLVTLRRCGIVVDQDELGEMRELSAALFADAVEAWSTRDALAHNELDARDRRIDDLRALLQGRVPVCDDGACAVAHVLLMRFLERIADHGVELTAHLSWAVTGDRVLAHHGPASGLDA